MLSSDWVCCLPVSIVLHHARARKRIVIGIRPRSYPANCGGLWPRIAGCASSAFLGGTFRPGLKNALDRRLELLRLRVPLGVMGPQGLPQVAADALLGVEDTLVVMNSLCKSNAFFILVFSKGAILGVASYGNGCPARGALSSKRTGFLLSKGLQQEPPAELKAPGKE
jgi:hypothetical protein